MQSHEFEPGRPFRLSPLVRRVVAPNAGRMTGPGTNTYLIGDKELALIDPGPALPAHIDAILDVAGDRLRWVLTTHTHTDHSPAWHAIKSATGAEVIGARPWDDQFQDDSFDPDREPTHDSVLATSEFSLRALHTPGHVDNHFCFLLEDEGVLFAGDHIMNGSTVVIVPPSGDMKAYIESLQMLLAYPLQRIAPGHGGVIDKPQEAIEWLINHRLARENTVIAALIELKDATLDELVKTVYADVDEALQDMAKLSLNAHLIKLQKEQRARYCSITNNWRFLPP